MGGVYCFTALHLGMNHETGANSRMRTGEVVPVGDLDSP